MKVFWSLVAVVVFAGGLLVNTRAQSKPSRASLVPSTLFDDVRRKLQAEPKISSVQLAQYANEMLAKKGIDFHFDLCEFIERNNPRPRAGSSSKQTEATSRTGEHAYRLPLRQTNGQQIIFEARRSEEQMEGMCGECFFAIAATKVTRQTIELIAAGKKYSLTRPRLFGLDEMSLVDASMRKVVRTWQVPDQGEPLGVSGDGTKLYLETEIDSLVLEISETSALRILAREQVKLSKGEYLEKHPTDPKNAYLSFMRFRVGGRRLVIRYSAACT